MSLVYVDTAIMPSHELSNATIIYGLGIHRKKYSMPLEGTDHLEDTAVEGGDYIKTDIKVTEWETVK
jgi:hypothetical protein